MEGSPLVVVHLPVSLTLRRMVAMEDGIPSVLQSTMLSTSSIVQVGKLPHFSDQWMSITFSMFVLSMVKDHHLQLRAQPPLFSNFYQFNIKVALGNHPVIQKEVQEI